MNFRQLIKDYFTFSRNERKGITILLIIIFLLAVANKVLFYFEKPVQIDEILLDSARIELGEFNDSVTRPPILKKLFSFNPNTIDSLALDSLDLSLTITRNLLKFRSRGGKLHSANDFKKIYGITDSVFKRVEPYLMFDNDAKVSNTMDEKKPELFPFDPNDASDNDFRRLGLSDKLISTIRKYQDKGGSFHSKTDFFKIWGLTDKQKRVLADFVVIKNNEITRLEKNQISLEQIELNSSDSIQLKQLNGIGNKLSKRIVKYRELLGGFYSIDQLREVYGLSEQTMSQIGDKVTVDVSKIKKIDLNFADMNELSRHPYIKRELAGRIVKFRAKNGSIRDLSVLRDSMILNMDEYTRLKPYF